MTLSAHKVACVKKKKKRGKNACFKKKRTQFSFFENTRFFLRFLKRVRKRPKKHERVREREKKPPRPNRKMKNRAFHTSITAVTTGINFFCRGGHGREENLKNLTAVKFCIDHGREIFPRFLLVSSFSFVDRARPPFPSLPSHSWGGKINIKSAKKIAIGKLTTQTSTYGGPALPAMLYAQILVSTPSQLLAGRRGLLCVELWSYPYCPD